MTDRPCLHWRPITEPPERPMTVLFYARDAEWYVLDTDVLVDTPPDAAVRFDVGWWDGAEWLQAGTNHPVFEFHPIGHHYMPTHWVPIVPPGDEP